MHLIEDIITPTRKTKQRTKKASPENLTRDKKTIVQL